MLQKYKNFQIKEVYCDQLYHVIVTELSPRSATTVNFSLAQVHNSKIQRSTLPKPVLSKAFALKMLSAGPAIVPRVAGLHGAAPSTVVSHKFKKTL